MGKSARLVLAGLLTMLLAGIAVVPAAQAANRALLVGIAGYAPGKEGDRTLPGARNDAALMYRTLRENGFEDENIIILADDFAQTGETRPANGMPTRAAIMAAFDRLAETAGRGDQIVVMLSGHGSLAPITSPASLIHHPDGLNPLFLPIDIGEWKEAVGAIENAIAGDEFGVKLAAIRNKGAFVWMIVDACHSGTISRGAEQGVVAKKVDPQALGVPRERLEAARKMAQMAQAQTRSTAASARPKPASALAAMPAAEVGYAAFFAAHPDELAIQRNLPKGYGGDKRPHGVLVFYTVQAMRSGRAQTYADLAQMVLGGYDQWGTAAPTPLFEGDLRKGLFGARQETERRFPARAGAGRLMLDAGVLDDVNEGALVALSDGRGDPLGFARVNSAGASSSVLEPVARGAVAAVDMRSLQEAGRLTAKIEERGLTLEMRVGAPQARPDFSAPEQLAQQAIVALMAAGSSLPPTIRVEAEAPAADLFLKIVNNRLWFTGPEGEVITSGRRQTASLALQDVRDIQAMEAEILKVLRSQLKVRNLIRAAETMGAGPAGQSLAIRAGIVQSTATAPAGAKAPDDRPCGKPELDRVPEGVQLLSGPAELPALAHCDVVYFALRNIGKKVLDITPLYVDGGGAIDYMGPPEGLRLQPGAPERIIPVTIVTWDRKRGAPYPIGLERMLFITVEQEDKTSLPADFRYLQQPALPRNTEQRGGSNALRALLEDAAFGSGRTRSASASPAIGSAGIAQFRWKVTAPE